MMKMSKWVKYLIVSEISDKTDPELCYRNIFDFIPDKTSLRLGVCDESEVWEFEDGVYHNKKDILYIKDGHGFIFKTENLKESLEFLKNFIIYQKNLEYDLNRKLLKEYMNKTKYTILGMMARGLSHEINNPLSIISTYCQYLLLEEKSEERTEILNNVLETVFRASNIIKKISQFAGENIEKEYINVFCELQGIIDFYENIRKYKFPDVNIELKVTAFEGGIYFNKNEFHELIFPILENACESFVNSGKIEISLIDQNNNMVISIADTGCGIKKSDLKKVFIPFFTTKGDNLGKGLGLTLAYYLVQKNKGNICIESKYHKGTIVTITLKGGKK